MFYVMAPDNVEAPAPVFTRHGRLGHDLSRAQARARKLCGRVYETNGAGNRLVADYWVEPKPVPKLSPREYRMARAETALFGHTL